jgi:hypothetical protein
MEGLLFLGLIVLVAVCLAVVSQRRDSTKEGFAPIAIPTPGPPAQPVDAGAKAQPYSPPSAEIPSAPYGNTSDVTSRPFQDPSRDKATYSRLYELLQDLNAFHDFEVEKLQDKSDPAVALPLGVFKGDRQRLVDEVAFLNRNPGLQSSLTIAQANEIRVNLTYLQKKARFLSDGIIEGFEDSPSTTPPSAKADAAGLQDASTRIAIEIARLQASGTTDPVYQTRVNVLAKINQQVQTIITQLKNKTLLPADVPITKKDLQDFLPAITDTSKPVNKFLDSIQAPSSLSNLFPSYEGGDISGAQLANAIFKNYGDAMFKGLSWDMNVKYTSQNEITKAQAEAEAKQRQHAQTPLDKQFQLGRATTVNPRGAFEQVISHLDSPGQRPQLPTQETAKFDWRERSSQICEAVRMQGLDPSDFGCMKDMSKVGDDFSWRGYAKMVCTRLQTTMDTGLPEACGCPPVGWPGWRQ